MTRHVREAMAPTVVAGVARGLYLQRADSVAARLRGLLGRDGLPAGTGLWIRPCNAVHTLGMRFAIDIVFLVVWFLGVERLPQGRKRKGGDLHAASKRPALYLDARRRMRRRTAAGSTTAPTGNRIQTLLTRSSQSPNAGP